MVATLRANNTDRIRSELERVDWDFPGAGTERYSVHTLHWFPGNFIPQIPRYLIQLLSKPEDVVYDPFCGTGTTPIESTVLRRRGLGSDISPTALQVASAKGVITSNPADVISAIKHAQDALLWHSLVVSGDPGLKGEGIASELCYWYHPHTLDQLRGIWKLVVEPADPGVRPVLEAVFTDTLFTCAATANARTKTGGTRRHHWGWIADNVKPVLTSPRDAVEIYLRRIERVRGIAAALADSDAQKIEIFRADARATPLEAESVDLVVTSPPYLGMIDYTRAARLTYLWYGLSMQREEAREIGARYTRNRADIQTVYMEQISRSVAEIKRCLRFGAYCALIIGGSRKFPEMTNAVAEVFADAFPLIWGPTPRRPSRRRVSERAGRDVREFLCVYRSVE